MTDNPYSAPAAKVADAASARPKSKYFVVRCLRGEARLWRAFWLVLVLGYVVLVAIALVAVLSFGVFGSNWWLEALWGYLAVTTLFYVFASVSVWRCAPNTDYRALRILARLVVLALVVYNLWGLEEAIEEDLWPLIKDWNPSKSFEQLR